MKPDPVVFLVQGKEVRLLEDRSEYALWNLRGQHADSTGMILQRFEARLREASAEEADAIITVLLANNQKGILWSALLMVAAERPEVYAALLWDLASHEKMLLSQSVRIDAIAAVAAFYPHRTAEDKRSFELAAFDFGAGDAFHQMEHERWLAGLFQAIGVDNLVTEEARAFLVTEQGAQPVPNEHWGPMVTVSAVTQRQVLSESGVDFEDTINDELQTKSEQVKERVGLLQGGNSKIEDVILALHELRNFHDAIQHATSERAHSDVIKNAEDMAGDLSVAIFAALSREELPPSTEDLALLNEVSLAVSRSQRVEHGRSPRASVVPALFHLAHFPETRKGAIARIVELVQDGDVHVRVLLAGNLTQLQVDAEQAMWSLADEIVAHEEDEAVLQVFVAAVLGEMLHHEAPRVEGMLLDIAGRFPFASPGGKQRVRENLEQSMAHVLGQLYVLENQDGARQEVFRWTEDPLAYKAQIRSALFAIRGVVCQGYDEDVPESAAPRARAQALIRAVVDATVDRIESYYQQDRATQERKVADARSLAECLSFAVANFYYGSGAFGERNMPNSSVVETEAGKKQFLSDVRGTLEKMGEAPVPQITYQLAQTLAFLLAGDPAVCFGLFAAIMRTSGKRQGFQVEALAVNVMVEIVSRCLAEYEFIFRDDQMRAELVECLDLFVEAGWPDAVRLAYRVPEALR